jgi:cell wall-associated NlpC family hydrolase
MRPTWFNSLERIVALDREAMSWRGTPFFANSNTKGKGVSCQKLVCEIYRGVGFCDVQVPDVPMAHARFSRDSLVEPFMMSLENFQRVDDPPLAGDLLGFRLGRVIHHLGIYLGKGAFVHTMEGVGVSIAHLTDATWSTRHGATWRPKP